MLARNLNYFFNIRSLYCILFYLFSFRFALLLSKQVVGFQTLTRIDYIRNLSWRQRGFFLLSISIMVIPLALSQNEMYNYFKEGKFFMHVITQKRIWEAKIKYSESANALDGWYRIVRKNQFNNFAELKKIFNSVDKVEDLYVFNVGGNKLRLITNIHFLRQKIYIRYILTHKEYNLSSWK